ncbi:MAG: ABC transporter permease [Verrucomicrobia bacterium]|nr:ABC transporter permease [Verrucomicrobiota bacterium]MBI3869408.1 ABC transporter permease [Verrucomicrobiota bacterium]
MRWAHEALECGGIAWDALRAHRLRSALTALGIIVGIVTVTLMGMTLDGLNAAFQSNLAKLGAETLYVQRLPWQITSYAEWLKLSKRTEFGWSQARRLEGNMTNAVAAAPITEGRFTVKYRERSGSGVSVLGTTPEYAITAGLTLSEGRFLSRDECEGGRPVCAIGFLVASNLFRGANPIGERLRIENESVEVIGVMAKRGSFMGLYSFDNQVVLPARFYLGAFQRYSEFTVQVKAPGADVLRQLEDEARVVMRVLRRLSPGAPDDFAINQQQSLLDSFGKVAGVIGSVGFFISGLSLLVGAIGIMNIMYVSVAERTREIGIRKAIGAKRRAILLQFLAEAAALCLIAGLCGLLLAWALSLLIATRLPVRMSFGVAFLALSVSIAVGVVSGFLPAWRAARMDPVEALRNE